MVGVFAGCDGTSPVEEGDATEEGCSGTSCSSTLTLNFAHTYDLSMGPHLLVIETPNFTLDCSVPAQVDGAKSCFGFAFADLAWDASRITVTVTDPFFATETQPDPGPFESVGVSVTRGGEMLSSFELPVDAGPDGGDPLCGTSCWQASASASLD